MQRAIAETDRRRQKQLEFNRQHGIEPRSIIKEVRDIMDGARDSASRRGRRAAEPRQEYRQLTPEQLARRISRLEKDMFEHARNLEFEEAARLRDELQALRRVELGLPATADPLSWPADAALPSDLAKGACHSVSFRPARSRRVAQWLEHFLDMEGVGGSTPLAPTINVKHPCPSSLCRMAAREYLIARSRLAR